MRRSLPLLCAAILILCACRETPPPARDQNTRVLIAGHLYGLGVMSHDEAGDELRSARYLSAFADEIRAKAPAAVFLLGDSTRNGREEEWSRLDRVFDRVEPPIHHLAGNHDLRSPELFDRRGGVRNAVFDIADRRFICLDNKCIYEPEDLAFLREALEVGGRPKPVILMHYCMIDWREAQPGQDPREDYPGVSNWNRDVAPIIAGRVEAVICGDHQPGGPKQRRQVVDGKTIDYILTSFVFGGGADRAGEGPNLYLEILLWGREIRILPRTVPVPLPDDWYLDARPPEDWRLHDVAGRAWIWTPPGFEKPMLGAWCDEERGLHLILDRRPWPVAGDFLAIRGDLSAELARARPGLVSLAGGDFEVGHQPARWEWVAQGEARFFYAFARVGDELWVFSGERTEADDDGLDWRAIMLEILRSMKPV